jgi:hypothetical protein
LWEDETSKDLMRFGFLIFCSLGRTRLSSDFGEIVLVERVGFSLRISEFDKVTKYKFVSHMCLFISDIVVYAAIFFSP